MIFPDTILLDTDEFSKSAIKNIDRNFQIFQKSFDILTLKFNVPNHNTFSYLFKIYQYRHFLQCMETSPLILKKKEAKNHQFRQNIHFKQKKIFGYEFMVCF